MIRAGSRSARRRRRSWRARSPKSCCSAMIVIGGSASTKPETSGATATASSTPEARNSSQPATIFGAMPCGRSRSSSSSRRPGDSAASRTRDSVARNAVANRVMLSSRRRSMRSSGASLAATTERGLSLSSATASYVPSSTCGRPRARPSHSCGSQEQLGGCQYRVFDVVAMFLVPLLDGTRRRRQRACGVLRQHQHGVVGQIVEERRRWTRRTAAGSTRCRRGRGRRRRRGTPASA